MKVRFRKKPQEPAVVNGLAVDYAPGRRIIPRLRWYLILLLVSSPLLFFLGRLVYENLFVEAHGYITPALVHITAPSAGKVAAILAEPGDRVLPGALLVQLEQPGNQRRLELLRQKLAHLERNRPSRRAGFNANMAETQIAYFKELIKFRGQQVEDMEFLAARGAATKADLEGSLLAAREAENHLALARLDLLQARSDANQPLPDDPVPARIDTQLAIVELESQMARLAVRTEQAGLVESVQVRMGEEVLPGAPLMVVGCTSAPRVTAFLDPADASYLRVGDVLKASTEDGDELLVEVTRLHRLTDALPSLYDKSYGRPNAKLVFEGRFLEPEAACPFPMGTPLTLRLANRITSH